MEAEMPSGREKGFTLIELMIVVALVAVMALVAIPSFVGLIRDNQVQAQAEEFNSLLQYARSESVIRRRAVNVDINAGTGLVDVIASGETLRSTTLNTNGIAITSTHPLLSFRPNGTSTINAYRAVFCRDGLAEKAFVVTVVGSGRATMHPRGRDESGNALGGC
tara:strand:+ start:819 stop:1310 length:492 start_codon:yes stop_codon:yes gene_type:complete